MVGRGIEEAEKSNSDKDFFTGKQAAFSRAAAMEASPAATSASTKARNRSSPDQRWALASGRAAVDRPG
jgi:hypothetical protein